MSSFRNRVLPEFLSELREFDRLMDEGLPDEAFRRLENAHVIGQESTRLHVFAHYQMARWAVQQKDLRELLGQVLRIVGAATKTVFGLVPRGNTGGSNVSPFKPMPLSAEHERIITAAKSGI